MRAQRRRGRGLDDARSVRVAAPGASQSATFCTSSLGAPIGVPLSRLRRRGNTALLASLLICIVVAVLATPSCIFPGAQVFMMPPSSRWGGSAHPGRARLQRVHRRFFDALLGGDKKEEEKAAPVKTQEPAPAPAVASERHAETTPASAPAPAQTEAAKPAPSPQSGSVSSLLMGDEPPKAAETHVAVEEKAAPEPEKPQEDDLVEEEGEAEQNEDVEVEPIEEEAEDQSAESAQPSTPKKSIDEFEVGMVIDATVKRNDVRFARYGMQVDIGAERAPKLNLSSKVAVRESARHLKKGEVVRVRVDSVDREKRLVEVSLDNEEATIAAWDSERIPIADVKVGSTVDGLVRDKQGRRAFMDIGCERDAALLMRNSIVAKLNYGEAINGMKVDAVDVEKGFINVSVEDPEALVAGRKAPQRQRKKPEAKSVTGTNATTATNVTAAKKSVAADKSPAKPTFSIEGLGKNIALDAGKNFTLTFDLKDPSVRNAIKKQLGVGIDLKGVEIVSVDNNLGKIVLSLGATSTAQKSSIESTGAQKEGKKAGGKKDNGSTAAGKVEMPPVKVGDKVKGPVRVVNQFGVFVDIGLGYGKDAKLNVSRESNDNFRFREELGALQVVKISEKTGRVVVDFQGDGPDGAHAAKEKYLAEQSPRTAISDVKEGSSLESYVRDKNNIGMFVDIGCVKAARLRVSKAAAKKYDLGDKLTVTVQSVNVEKEQISVVLPDADAPADESSAGEEPPAEAASDEAAATD